MSETDNSSSPLIDTSIKLLGDIFQMVNESKPTISTNDENFDQIAHNFTRFGVSPVDLQIEAEWHLKKFF